MRRAARVLTVLSGVGLTVLAVWWLLGAALLVNDPPWSFIVGLYAFVMAGTGIALIFPPPIRELYYFMAVGLPALPYVLALVIGIASPNGIDPNVLLSNYVVGLIPAAPAILAGAGWSLSRAQSGNISGN